MRAPPKNDIHKKEWVFFTVWSKPNVSPSCCHTIHTALPHGVDCSCNEGLGEVCPLLLQVVQQLLSICWQRVVFLNSPPKLTPDVLNGVDVRAVCRPWHPGDASLHHKCVHGSTTMWGSIIVHEHSLSPNLLECWGNQRL